MSWYETTVGEALVFNYGKSLPDRDRKDGDVTVYGSGGVVGSHHKALVAGPGIVVGRKGTIGATHWAPNDFFPIDTTYFITPKRADVDLRYAYFLLSHLPLASMNSDAAVPGLNRENVYRLKIRLPELKAQQRIAATLSAYDDLIDNNRRRIALLEEAASQLYKEWFVRFRFPGHEHAKIVNGVPEGWERLPLGDVLTLQRGFDLTASDRIDGSVPVYGSTGILGFHDTARVEAPMIITGRSGSLGQVCFVSVPCWPLNTALWVREFKRASPWFSFFLLSEMGLEKFNGGVSVPTLDRKVAHAALVTLPSEPLLEKFDEVSRRSFELIDNLKSQSTALAKARDLLLPRLMSGAIAV